MVTPAPLTGLAIGDSLGMPFETQTPLAPTLVAWDGFYGSSSYHRLGPGQWTDDTQMSLALAESLVHRGGYDPITTAEAYRAWYLSGDCRGIGSSTRLAMNRLCDGGQWFNSGTPNAEGNGSAMRASPIGLFHHRGEHKFASAAQYARLDAAITHRSKNACEGSAAIAVATSYLVSGGKKEGLLPTVIGQLRISRLRITLEELHEAIGRGADMPQIVSRYEWILNGVSAHVLQSVTAAFAMFLLSGTFAHTVRNAVRLGGDTDTTASMAGALAGAFYGIEGIPEYFLERLEGRQRIADLERFLLG